MGSFNALPGLFLLLRLKKNLNIFWGRKVASSESEKNIQVVWWCWRKTATGWWSWCTQVVAIFATFWIQSLFFAICSNHWVRTVVFRYLTCQRIWFFVFCGSFLAGMRNGGKKFWAALFTITRKESSASAGRTSRRTDATAAWLAHYFPNLRIIGVWVMSSHVILVKTLIGSVPILIARRWWPRIKQNHSVFSEILECFMKRTVIYSTQIFS